MWTRLIMELFNNHRGKFVGTLVGFVFAILVLLVGFWRTFFIACCVGVGYIIGKRFDDDDSLSDLIGYFFKEK